MLQNINLCNEINSLKSLLASYNSVKSHNMIKNSDPTGFYIISLMVWFRKSMQSSGLTKCINLTNIIHNETYKLHIFIYKLKKQTKAAILRYKIRMTSPDNIGSLLMPFYSNPNPQLALPFFSVAFNTSIPNEWFENMYMDGIIKLKARNKLKKQNLAIILRYKIRIPRHFI